MNKEKEQPELFGKKEIIATPKKRRELSEGQMDAMRRIRVKRYFGDRWRFVYGRNWLEPPNSWMSVDDPLKKALNGGYSEDDIKRGIDAYFDDKFEFFVQNCHPIKSFTKDIPKWVKKGEIGSPI